MDCRTAEGMVSSYIKHDLPLNELEEFLDHVQNCSSCYDELETYFDVKIDLQPAMKRCMQMQVAIRKNRLKMWKDL